jgi:DNA-directed RNA polymerase subunit E'/Rpb7
MLSSRQILSDKIKLEPRYLTKTFKDEILNRLKQKVEGICSKHGFIVKDTIEIYKVNPGEIELASLCGNIVYNVYFYADVCNPLIGSTIKSAKVVNLNRLGILAEASISQQKFTGSVVEIIVAKNSVKITSDIDLDKIKIGDEINVEVVGKRFSIGDRKVSVIGRIVKDADNKEPRYKTAYKTDKVDDVEEEELDELVPEEEEEEEEVEEEDADEEDDEEEPVEDNDEPEADDEFFSDDIEDDASGGGGLSEASSDV